MPVGDPYAPSDILLEDAAANQISVSVGQITRPASPRTPDNGIEPSLPPANRTVAGRPVFWDGQRFISDDWDGLPVAVTANGPAFGEAEATRVLAGLRVSADLRDPGTWPASIVG